MPPSIFPDPKTIVGPHARPFTTVEAIAVAVCAVIPAVAFAMTPAPAAGVLWLAATGPGVAWVAWTARPVPVRRPVGSARPVPVRRPAGAAGPVPARRPDPLHRDHARPFH